MGYQFREVICPYCHHKFMWQKDVQDGSSWKEYRNKLTNELCLSAKCPVCSNNMIVSSDFITGIDIDSTDFKESIVRGL